MPWQIIEKTYGKDKRYDSIYHIEYRSTQIKFDIICKYVSDEYKWLLFSEDPHIQNVLIGSLSKINDQEACRLAAKKLRKVISDRLESLEGIENMIERHLKNN